MTIFGTPFETVLEAIRWSLDARGRAQYGAHAAASGGITRPCEPSDVTGVLRMLFDRQQISRLDLEVLAAMVTGRPHPAANDERLTRIDAVVGFHLERKGILRAPLPADA